ncbi:hypothetical protein ACHAXR_007401 [Thalassiosira sp. AJA248-18]
MILEETNSPLPLSYASEMEIASTPLAANADVDVDRKEGSRQGAVGTIATGADKNLLRDTLCDDGRRLLRPTNAGDGETQSNPTPDAAAASSWIMPMPPHHTKTSLHIISANYGPAEGRRLLDGKLVDYNKKESFVPYTRDVLPFLMALMRENGFEENGFEENDFDFQEGDAAGVRENRDIHHHAAENGNRNSEDYNNYYFSQTTRQKKQLFQNREENNTNAFPLMDGRPMNAVFGDPCPGTTKILRVEYLFRDLFYDHREAGSSRIFSVAENDGNIRSSRDTHALGGAINGEDEVVDSNGPGTNDGTRRTRRYHCTTSRVFQSTFREHERVLLKRQDPLFRLTTDNGEDATSNSAEEQQQRRLNTDMKLGNIDCEKAMKIDDAPPRMISISSSTTPLPHIQSQLNPALCASSSSPSPSKRWRLAPTTSEITLPIILPFLTVRQRANCQLVCSSWRDIVLEKGIAVVVDVNDVGLFPKDQMEFASTTSMSPSSRLCNPQSAARPCHHVNTNSTSNNNSPLTDNNSSVVQGHASRSLLRGLLNNSHSSLESLVLNDFSPLEPIVDLHPALPYLRKLKRLDISRIPSISDETLDLISTFIGERLEVLYMKGLRHVTNDGVVRLVSSCFNLRVLDVSQVHQLNDEAGIAISQLKGLEVLHGKDNYKLTNRSVDAITKNCRKLVQVTFWGCIKLTRLCFDENERGTDNFSPMPRPTSITDLTAPSPTKLILLNLWGCHNLTDDCATRMASLPHLRSLCVSECHRLTDQFVFGITQSLPQLLHLQLRYLRRITDASLASISHRMLGLYSLDLSFCTKLTVGGLAQLLTSLSLSELRLYSCRQLDMEGGSLMNGGRNGRNGLGVGGGRQLVQALRSVREVSILSFLDLRECHQHEPFVRDDLFLNGMLALGFDEALNGLFVRTACWNGEMRCQRVANLNYADRLMS